MVQSKADREKQKFIADKCQSLIEVLLKDEDNKYCVDCDAKGPRWASWNLGIFLCIRCAGIHRNLGVHISRVKSVNLDAWTPDHVAYMQRMGNSRARAIYEANLPDDFRRPQTDTALESFIRAKYEHKKYIVHDYVDPGPPEPAFNVEEELKRIKEQKRNKLTGGQKQIVLPVSDSLTKQTNPESRPTQQPQQQHSFGLEDIEAPPSKPSTKSNKSKTNSSALDDLIDLDIGFNAAPEAVSNNNIINTINNLSANISNLSTNQSTNIMSANVASLADLIGPASTPGSASIASAFSSFPSAIPKATPATPSATLITPTSKQPQPQANPAPLIDSLSSTAAAGPAAADLTGSKNVFDLLDL